MRDVQEMKDELDQLRQTIEEAKALAKKLARNRLIDPGVPQQRRYLPPPDPVF
ncbi:hypothetical protein KIH74_09425 [Kineosporia sp. J2-2]|uniref:Uncharacterized protein n=1 Tax=Kineosporia corallincola TaxID=2835133 RepID=A0ABS5TGC7_9ACTN|nr:hypothetical protein [Kineosporia corallincola]MBT0769138.1 hypothetical protein [Kineosporia corallincola]